MTGSTKQKTLIWLGLVIVSTAIIAAGLPQLQFRPGLPLPTLEDSAVILASAETQPSQPVLANKFIIIFLLILVAGFGLYGVYKLLHHTTSQNLTVFIWLMGIVSLLAGGFVFLILWLLKSEGWAAVELPGLTPQLGATAPLGAVPPLLVWLVGLGLPVTGVLIAVWLFRPTTDRATTMDVVGYEAEKAWRELKAGLGLPNVIIRCYRQMNRALAEEQGLAREDFMTAREFETLLAAAGVPAAPIRQLTQLFEAVRYGHWQPNLVDEQKAMHCLEAIMLYSRKVKEAD